MKRTFFFLLLCFTANVFAKDIHSLYPYPKAAWSMQGQFTITNSTKIVIPDVPTPAEMTAIVSLQNAIWKQTGYTLGVSVVSTYSGAGGIIIGEFSNPFLQSHLQLVMPRGESMPSAQGYVLHISSNEILIVGTDTLGTYNAVVTLSQLLNGSGAISTVNAAHIWDYPDYPVRWIFSSHNLLVSQQVSALEALADTMALYKLNGIQQNDFKYSILQNMGSNYFKNVDSLKSHLLKQNIEVIPGVAGIGWSSGILYNDPNLAEGLPATAIYYMESDTGRLITNPQAVITNGDFEAVSNNQFTGWNGGGSFYDGPNLSTFVDHSVFHGGSTSAKCTNFTQGNASGNCRFSKLITCDSNKSYSLSAWIKTQDLQGGYTQLLALGGASGQTLTFTSLSIPSTTDWTRVEVNFNSLSNTSVRLYVGVWGGQSGTIWFDDFSIKEAGLSSVLRRTGCPLTVINKNTGHIYIEGTDYQKVVDPWLDSHKDSYFPCHTPPTFKRIFGGAINNGDSIIIKYYHPFAAVSDNSGNGSVMACVSEDTLYKILGDQITRVNDLYHPHSFFMGHDEIRNMNHDKICTDRHIWPASQLADNISKCHDLITSTNKSADVLMWSDMVDSLHNAHNNYYLINGDLTGDWNNIPKDITIVNWNGGYAKPSLQFFEHYGFKQISSPYYDAGNTSTIRAWRIAQEGVSNVRGMMYTTWNNDYNFIRHFAYYAWGAGPNIIHTPLDTSILSTVSFTVSADVISDPFDKNGAIVTVEMNVVDSIGSVLNIFTLTDKGGNTFSASVPNSYKNGLRYYISAVNKQGITRILPTYVIMPAGKAFAAPILMAPANNSADTISSKTFKWHPVASTNGYHIQLSTSQTFTPLKIDSARASVDTIFSINNLPADGTKYFWRVAAIGDAGIGPWSEIWNFTMQCAPVIPNPLSPADTMTVYADTVTLNWLITSCDDLYDVQVSPDSLFLSNVIKATGLAATSHLISGLARGVIYFWHVRGGTQSLGMSGWSSLKRFTTAPAKGVSENDLLHLSLSNHPNPSRSETTVDFRIPYSGLIKLRLLNILGNEIRTILSEYLEAGLHHITMNVSDLPNGTYIYELRTPDGVISKQMQIVK